MAKIHPLVLLLLLSGMLASPQPVSAQTFRDVSVLLNAQPVVTPQVGASVVDINNDGLIDLYHPGTLYLQRPNGTYAEVLVSLEIGGQSRTISGGLFGDADNNGYVDVFFTDLDGQNGFYLNRSGNVFVRSNQSSNVRVPIRSQGAAWGDFNTDGALDLFVVNNDNGAHRILINQDNLFTDLSTTANVVHVSQAQGISASDYDRDGDLDLYITGLDRSNSNNSQNFLLQNNGNATFNEIGQDARVRLAFPNQGVVWLDYDNDGWMDLYVTSQLSDQDIPAVNRLYHNEQDGKFTLANDAGVATFASYSAAAADFDNDGWIDMYATRLGFPPNLFHNNGNGTFTDVYADTGIPNITQAFESGVAVADLNGDGWVDLFQPSGQRNHLLYSEGGSNHWLKIKTRGISANYHGVGARVEVYAGGQGQVREITVGDGFGSQSHALTAHFGLGQVAEVDSVVVRWPGGHVDRFANVAADRELTVVEGMGFNVPPVTFTLIGPADGETLLPVNGQIEFTWNPSSDPDGDPLRYNFHFAGPGIDTLITDLQTTRLSLSDDLFAPNITYTWTVAATDGRSIRNSTDRFAIGGSPTTTVPEPLNIPYAMPPAERGSVDLGDYDNDGDLDLLLTGLAETGPFTRVFQLDDSVFTVMQGDFEFQQIFKQYRDIRETVFRPVWRSAARWGDVDGDGDLDIASTGIFRSTSTQTGVQIRPITRIYINIGNGFIEDLSQTLPGVHSGSLDWGDYDNDGDLDLLLAGATQTDPPYEPVTKILRNDDGLFIDTEVDLPGVVTSAVSWADYDGDGDLDVTLLGTDATGVYLTRIYRNDGSNNFTDVQADLPQLAFGSLDWGDYDEDGDLDLLVSGGGLGPNLVEGIARVYRNEGGGALTDVRADIVQVTFGKAIWGDYDTDGDLDIILSGAESIYGSRDGWVYRNDGDEFRRELRLGSSIFGDMAAGDYNNDGDLDYVTFGLGVDDKPFITFFVNRIFPDPIPASLLSRN